LHSADSAAVMVAQQNKNNVAQKMSSFVRKPDLKN
jgi:hypothetical protein